MLTLITQYNPYGYMAPSSSSIVPNQVAPQNAFANQDKAFAGLANLFESLERRDVYHFNANVFAAH